MIKLTCNPFQFKHEIHVLATTMFVTRKCLRLILWLCNVYEKNDDMSSQSCTWKPFLWSSAVIYEDDQIQFWRTLRLRLASVVYPEPSHNAMLLSLPDMDKGRTPGQFFFSMARELTPDAQRFVCATRSERGWTDTFRNLHLLELPVYVISLFLIISPETNRFWNCCLFRSDHYFTSALKRTGVVTWYFCRAEPPKPSDTQILLSTQLQYACWVTFALFLPLLLKSNQRFIYFSV